ncbi:hypothetical protein [Piscinibacter gummiphilus]|uniref:hypothetical protein n=1 Tax=Piscinibacter gummiphilus TaxID=946333 RepID=UPI0012F50FBA|nr:hypothetical protein [Piscinibacter gummiphilus]
MTDDIAVGMRGQGWSAVGGRVIPPSSAAPHRAAAAARSTRPGELTGRVSFTTSDGLLGPGRRLRYRRARWVRHAVVWLAIVLLAPLVAGWAWGLLGSMSR